MSEPEYKLVVYDLKGVFAVGWDDATGDGVNCWLGEHLSASENGSMPEKDTAAAELAVKPYAENCGAVSDHNRVWLFDKRTHAVAAKKLANQAIALLKSKKEPAAEWERVALSQGWKPPKGRF